MFVRLAIALVLMLAAPARALTIVGYDPAVNDRFASGYSGTPVENTSPTFLGAGFDLSGVGWNTANSMQSFAMISDEYFVYSNHYAPGSTLSFFSPTLGTVVEYAVGSTYQFTYNGETSDFAIGRLSTPLDSAHGITSYAILDLAQASDYIGLTALVYGHGGSTTSSPRLASSTVDFALTYDLSGPEADDSIGIAYEYNSGQPGDFMFEAGDSSSPSFTVWGGQLVLIGTHSAISTEGTPYSIDNLIAAYTDQMSAQGIAFGTVPEPSRSVLLLLGACALLLRRHRAPQA